MKNVKIQLWIKKVLSLFLGFGLLAGCSNTEFSERQLSLQSYTVRVGQVDILFVVDNSGSMSEEQRRMANSFPNFVQGLDIAGLDYRIGIITTDIQSRTNPLVNSGVLQNGNLIPFPDGSSFLTPDSSNIESQFLQTIQRPETLACENSNFNSSFCPSDDERGIYAAYLAVNANKANFFRENGHVAFVFLSDEDVRGFGISSEQNPFRLPEALDYPENLIQVTRARLGTDTEISAHAIVTDSNACRLQQQAQGGNVNIHGAIGQLYITMTDPASPSLISNSGRTLNDFAQGQLVRGSVGSICSNDYVAELGNVRTVLTQTKSRQPLRCRLFSPDDIEVRISSEFSWTLNEDLDELIFTPALPPGTSFRVEHECP